LIAGLSTPALYVADRLSYHNNTSAGNSLSRRDKTSVANKWTIKSLCPVGAKHNSKQCMNTYTQIHLHCIFAVKYRAAMIEKNWKENLHGYITGIVQNHKHKMIGINTMPDHLHMLIGMRPHQSLSDLMRIVKGDSSEWINEKRFCLSHFRWQEGYGAFSYEKSKINVVASYIENQELHHHKKTFLEEYVAFLDEFEIDYDERYLFKLPE
jgi:putative transposase